MKHYSALTMKNKNINFNLHTFNKIQPDFVQEVGLFFINHALKKYLMV